MRRKTTGKLNGRSGFTLAELLVVIAIIAVLVAVAISVFKNQVEKAKEATDLADIRSAYAEVMTEVIGNGNESFTKTVDLVQSVDGWLAGSTAQATLESLGEVSGTPVAGGTCEVSFNTDAKKIKFNFTGTPSGGGSGSGTGSGDSGSGQTGTYNFGNERKSRMTTMAQALSDLIKDMDPEVALRYMDWKTLEEKNYNLKGLDGRDETITLRYREIHLDEKSSNSLNSDVKYWVNGKEYTYNIGQMLTDIGVDYSGFTGSDSYVGNMAVVYFDPDTKEPIAVSYYNEGNSGKYRYTFLDDGSTYEANNAGYRQYYAYNEDYAKEHLTKVNG